MLKEANMGQINQCEYRALVAQGYTGALPGMRYRWEQAEGILNDLIFHDVLLEQGYDGAFPDMERHFWCDGGELDTGGPLEGVVASFPLKTGIGGIVDGVPIVANFTRAVGPSTVEDFEGAIHVCKDGEARFWRARRVENYYPGNSNTVDVLTIPLVVGQAYNISMEASVAFTLANVSGGLSHSYIFQDANDRIGFGGATVLIATTDTCNITIDSGGLQNIQVDKLTGSMSTNNNIEYVETGTGLDSYHGANVEGVKYFENVRSTGIFPGARLTDMRGCLVEGSDTNLMQTDTELGMATLDVGTYSFQFSSTDPANPSHTVLIMGATAMVDPVTTIVASGDSSTFEVTTAGDVMFAPSVASIVQQDTNRKYVQMLQAGTHVGSFVTGTRPAEALSVPRPSSLQGTNVNDANITVRTHQVSKGSAVEPIANIVMLNSLGGDAFGVSIQDKAQYLAFSSGLASIVDDDLAKFRKISVSLHSVDVAGLKLRVNDEFNDGIGNVDLDLSGSDDLIHLGTNAVGANPANAGISGLFVSETGLPSNLFVNGRFEDNDDGWLKSGSVSWNAGVESFGDTSGSNILYQNFTISETGTYRFRCDITNSTAGGGLLWFIEDTTTAFPAETEIEVSVQAGAWSMGVIGNGTGGGTVDVDNIHCYRVA